MRLRYKKNAIPEMKENPLMIFNPNDYKGKWREVFSNDYPIELEIGAGKGDFIKEKSLLNKNINYLALEMNTNAFVIAGRKFQEEKLSNIRGIIGKAENLEDMFEKGEISKIYLNFSTPWPKKRHHKRRLSHKNFLDSYKNIIEDGAEILLKTDNREFFDDTLQYFLENGLEILEKDYDLSKEKSGIITEYERKWRDRSMPIFYVRARF